ncbi:HNH endonuclease [Streptomyces sp. KL118A]|uniref:HNH endonuclease n=1 Tax=Streptomyces sp. KL118A TaxID=3045153 RepID=UPI00278C0356|nr:HNH endonuclease signature motif containing protein [Streptomyces sp. KL118A]
MEPSGSGSLPSAVRQAVLNAYGEGCTYCSWEEADAIDHVIPVSEGGRDDVSNIVPACRSCNSSKRDRTILRWQRDIHSRPAGSANWMSALFGGPSYHDPDRVVDLPAEAVVKHVERVQDEVAENFGAHEIQVALRLLNDLNRFIARMGNLSPERRSLLRKEALLRLLDYEDVLLAEPHDRRRALWEADLRQIDLKRALRDT